MPFAHLTPDLTSWIQASRDLNTSASNTALTVSTQRSLRGMVFVSLFGAYERTVGGCVRTALQLGSGHAVPMKDLKLGLLPFAVHDELQAFRGVGPGRMWDKSRSLFERVRSPSPAQLCDVFPADGSFMRPDQLRLIWQLFHLNADPWPHPRLIGRIHELVDTRNRVAHGEEHPGAVGGRFSQQDIDDRVQDVELLCTHVIAAFQAQCVTAAGFLA